MVDWSKLIHNIAHFYYAPLIQVLTELTALIVVLFYGRKTKIDRAFAFYIAYDFCILIIGNIVENHSSISKKQFSFLLNYSNTLISLIEIWVYYIFFFSVLESKKIKAFLTGLLSVYTLLTIVFLFTRFDFISDRMSYMAYILNGVELVFMLPPCLFFFSSLLNKESSIPLHKRPSFWIVTGVFLYSLISIPFYFISKYIIANYMDIWPAIASALFITPFTINFIFLIKAFLCKRTVTI